MRWRAPAKWWLQGWVVAVVLLGVLVAVFGPWYLAIAAGYLILGAAMRVQVSVDSGQVESKSTFAAGWRLRADDVTGYFVENGHGSTYRGSRVVFVLRREIDGHSTRSVELSGTNEQVRNRLKLLEDSLRSAGFTLLNDAPPSHHP